MIVLDLLAATVECWIIFLAQILPKIRRYIPELWSLGAVVTASFWVGMVAHISWV